MHFRRYGFTLRCAVISVCGSRTVILRSHPARLHVGLGAARGLLHPLRKSLTQTLAVSAIMMSTPAEAKLARSAAAALPCAEPMPDAMEAIESNSSVATM